MIHLRHFFRVAAAQFGVDRMNSVKCMQSAMLTCQVYT
jgi:hypothetical protein